MPLVQRGKKTHKTNTCMLKYFLECHFQCQSSCTACRAALDVVRTSSAKRQTTKKFKERGLECRECELLTPHWSAAILSAMEGMSKNMNERCGWTGRARNMPISCNLILLHTSPQIDRSVPLDCTLLPSHTHLLSPFSVFRGVCWVEI